MEHSEIGGSLHTGDSTSYGASESQVDWLLNLNWIKLTQYFKIII